MDREFNGKTVVITGATSGIGLHAAAAFAARGAYIIGAGRSPEKCQKAERELRAAYPAAFATWWQIWRFRARSVCWPRISGRKFNRPAGKRLTS